MLDGRLYRTALLPLLPVLIVVAFSLTSAPAPLPAGLAPDFDGGQAQTTLQYMEHDPAFADRRPGSRGDDALASYVYAQLSQPSSPASTAGSAANQQPPFSVSMRHFRAQTISGSRELETVVATRPGSVDSQIVVIAHRDAATPGSPAELSATAGLLELYAALSNRVTNHTITLVSTSGGSGGDAGAAEFAANSGGPVDAVIVLGDIAGQDAHRPFAVAWSDGLGSAPDQLQLTVQGAISQEVGADPGTPDVVAQFAHLAFPFTVGEQGVLNAAGLPAVMVQVSGEQGPPADDVVGANSEQRMTDFGRAALLAITSVDQDPAGQGSPAAVLLIQSKVMPAWAIRLLVAALLLAPLLAAIDGLARARRRREPIGRWLIWVLSCAAPFLLCALFVMAIGHLGILGAAPGEPVTPRALPVTGGAQTALLAATLVGLLTWLGRALLLRRLGMAGRPVSTSAAVALLIVFDIVALLVWLVNPFTALLLVPALHLWLLLASEQLRPRPPLAVLIVAASTVLVVGVVALLARDLGMSPVETAWTALLLVAGGHIDLAASVLWSLGLGCVLAAATIAVRGGRDRTQPPPVTVRGPLSYAGPGSLGGTQSALRR